MTDAEMIADLIRRGALIPIEVFGAEDGFGLSDRFSTHAPGGSDCNRANLWMLRPSDATMVDVVAASLGEVLDDEPKPVAPFSTPWMYPTWATPFTLSVSHPRVVA